MNPEFSIIFKTTWLAICASSHGGPGRNLEEHKGGNTTFGTKNPLFASSAFGVHNSC